MLEGKYYQCVYLGLDIVAAFIECAADFCKASPFHFYTKIILRGCTATDQSLR